MNPAYIAIGCAFIAIGGASMAHGRKAEDEMKAKNARISGVLMAGFAIAYATAENPR